MAKKMKSILIIMDGYGLRDEERGNAIKSAHTPNLDKLFIEKQWVSLGCSGEDVGLPNGQMGNSEVGHLNIGAGRIVYQNITRIDLAIKNGSFYKNKEFLLAIDNCKKNRSSLHIFGLLSDGGVHSSLEHLWALLKLAKKSNLKKVYLHAFMDGRDTSPTSGIGFIKQFQNKAKEIGIGKIATISGRYYAMDRDNRWERIEKAYRAISYGYGIKETNPITAIEKSYQHNITDEFIIPIVIEDNGKPVATVEQGDSIIFYNFRADRARQLTQSFIYKDFDKFKRPYKDTFFICMTQYNKDFDKFVHTAYAPVKLKNVFGEVLAKNGMKQLRIAETEKYAHVTFFFNGGLEKPFPNEDRILIPSPKVATYDLQPEMSAYKLTDEVIKKIESEQYNAIILNFANCDMVGHTGIFEAAVRAVEAVDKCIGKIIKALEKHNYDYIITADHGNAEFMFDENGNPMTAHTTNKVPFIISSDKCHCKRKLRENGILADIIPSLLEIMNIDKPEEMTGKSLII
ncbi:MAG: 2,3-bisphosphoglycerate-independent phosphoglycerate mutase [Candidatus Cloacimonadota bacterium]|nr:MAG: 2,3-bisphosphoglycerate-independent phosphoglycerate mutase [Candidatus Cloacimonadota bacterium]